MEGIPSPPSKSSGSSYSNALLISLLGICLTSFAIIFYHFLLVKYCMRRHTTAAAASAAAAPPFTGVDEKVLETIPIFTFTEVKRGTDDQEECVVCLGELEDEDPVRLLPNCKHAFHVTCIDQWFATQTTCPLCRSPVVPEQTDPEPSVYVFAHSAADPDCEICESSTSITIRDRPTTEQTQPYGLFRHCASLVLPPSVDRATASSPMKRSLSMDQSLIVMNLQRTSSSSPSSGALRRTGSYSSRSFSHSERVSFSSRWLRSFPRLRGGKRTTNGPILPY